MFENIENLKIVFTVHKANKPYINNTGRKNHSFIFRAKGSVLYSFSDENILTTEGDLIFLPKGISYTAKVVSDEAWYTSIHFEGDFEKQLHPTRYSLENFYGVDYIENCFSDMWNLGTQAEKYECLSLFYSLLSYLSTLENTSDTQKSKYQIIQPAVTYLREHMFECTLRIDNLHRTCGISNTYFRQIFTSNFGMTPQSYIISKRLARAKAIINTGDFDTIGEVALLVGFNDPLYFSKLFKKTYGISPSNINK